MNIQTVKKRTIVNQRPKNIRVELNPTINQIGSDPWFTERQIVKKAQAKPLEFCLIDVLPLPRNSIQARTPPAATERSATSHKRSRRQTMRFNAYMPSSAALSGTSASARKRKTQDNVE